MLFADSSWPALAEKALALVVASRQSPIVPWESISLPHEVDGSEGAFRAPVATRTLDATNDYQAVQTWVRRRHPASGVPHSSATDAMAARTVTC